MSDKIKRYCAYCGRVAHRCQCAKPDSRLRRFLARAGVAYRPVWMPTPYKRGVPPQVKQRERAIMGRQRKVWYAALVEQFGEHCQHCGTQTEPALDHVLPVAKGGLSELSNLQLLCRACNTAKGKLWYDCRPSAPDTECEHQPIHPDLTK